MILYPVYGKKWYYMLYMVLVPVYDIRSCICLNVYIYI